jgi:hypothetical protein
MQQIADWLEKLGMSEYTQRFAENDVDISVLTRLSDHDLKELGVSLGHRRKMLAAIAKLETGGIDRAAGAGSCGRAPACHGHVLRFGGFDRYLRQARR